MSEDKRYNGWTNHSTWCVNLWLDNEQGSQEYWRETAAEIYQRESGRGTITRRESARFVLADNLKEQISNGDLPDIRSMYLDLLTSALSEVNWDEIAEHMIDDVADEIDEEEKEDEPRDEEFPGLDEELAFLKRERMIELLESAGIQSYDHESDDVLREAVKINIMDGTIDRNELP